MRQISGEHVVLTDGVCSEPIAWCRTGDAIIGQAWGRFGNQPIVYTRTLTPPDAVEMYGACVRVVVTPAGRFLGATYGETVFISSLVDPREFPDVMVTAEVITHVRDQEYECVVCGAEPFERCISTKKITRHRDRGKGRSGEWYDGFEYDLDHPGGFLLAKADAQ